MVSLVSDAVKSCIPPADAKSITWLPLFPFLLSGFLLSKPGWAHAHKETAVNSAVLGEQPLFSQTALLETLPWVLVIILLFICADLAVAFLGLRKRHVVLQEEYAKRKLLLNSVAEGVYGLDLQGNCTFCNSATLRFLGYQSEDELIGRNIHNLIHHTHADGSIYSAEDCKACLAYKKNMEVHLEDEVFWRADGTSFQAEYWSYPIRKGTRLVGAVVSFLDVAERKATEAKLVEANRELDAFVYTVSHDLRTPLSAITGYADLLKEIYSKELSADAWDMLTAIEAQGNKMAGLVEDLLALATAGTLERPSRPVDVRAEVDYVIKELQGELAHAGVQVVIGSLPDVRVSATLLTQIFENLIGNALRYAGSAGGPIEVGGERRQETVRFYVRDHGPGIPVDERARVFDVFFRGSVGKKIMGSGVGLATVQKIARLYGGRAWVEETEGGGATFLIEMEDVLPVDSSDL